MPWYETLDHVTSYWHCYCKLLTPRYVASRTATWCQWLRQGTGLKFPVMVTAFVARPIRTSFRGFCEVSGHFWTPLFIQWLGVDQLHQDLQESKRQQETLPFSTMKIWNAHTHTHTHTHTHRRRRRHRQPTETEWERVVSLCQGRSEQSRYMVT